MADKQPPRPGAASSNRAKWTALGAACGVGMAAICGPLVSGWENGPKGPALVPYRDIVGVWTQCSGETLGVTARSPAETPEGCAIKLDTRLAGFARAVAACTPALRGHDPQWAAATSLAYNIGTAAYCRSTVDRRFDAGQWRAGCDAMLLWDKAGGRRVQGLANRRAAERVLCLRSPADLTFNTKEKTMTTMRAKLQISSVTKHSDSCEQLKFNGVAAKSYPTDGSDEDNSFAKFSPSVSLDISITNPALIGKFEPGQRFYVDFTPAQ